jgi:8-oxo-dGTP pyrophosphatase MutT (NUDIX family)
MNFKDFLNNIHSISNFDLPAINSHLKMAPSERIRLMKEAQSKFLDARKAAVMMLFYPKNDIVHLVLIVRNTYPGVHSSQIAFPGGKVEITDINLQETALRETHEEIGIAPNTVKVIRAFSEIYIPPSNFLVYPFLGISENELQFKLQIDEVAGIIEMPLSALLDDSIIVSKIIDASYAKAMEVPAFQIDEHIVWGATAMMLSELKDVLKMVF